jgi:hypothetical protein
MKSDIAKVWDVVKQLLGDLQGDQSKVYSIMFLKGCNKSWE